ncbi:MAG: MFS transporter [Verrucomicrobiaceae bacterium]|nr:MFS transporter [Verrucomicrobiaceae bacterium]
MIQSLLWLCLSTLLTVAGFAGALPAAATVMEKQGMSAGVIGVITSFVYAGVLCMAPFQLRLAKRFGAVVTYQMGKVSSACGFTGLAFAHHEAMWSLATLCIGLGAGLTWPVTDSLVAAFAPEDKKGSWMGLFQTGMGAAFALGPFIASVVKPDAMFITAAITGLVTSLPLLGRRVEMQRDASAPKEGLWEVLRMAPELPVLGFIGGFFENGTHTAITLSALALSWKESAAIALAGVIGAGAFVIQYPVGKLADTRGAHRIIVITLLVMIASCLPLPMGHTVPWLLWVIAFVWGAAGGCLYTLAMTGMAQRFSGARVMTATTIMVMSYTVGGISGPAVAGYAVEWSPLIGPMVLFIVASLLGLMRRRPGSQVSCPSSDCG